MSLNLFDLLVKKLFYRIEQLNILHSSFQPYNKWLTIISIFSKTRSETLIKLCGGYIKMGRGRTVKVVGKFSIARLRYFKVIYTKNVFDEIQKYLLKCIICNKSQ